MDGCPKSKEKLDMNEKLRQINSNEIKTPPRKNLESENVSLIKIDKTICFKERFASSHFWLPFKYANEFRWKDNSST